ncbi:MAG TPA: NADPH-dependent FMN reductase [Rhodocyclaceae bacterium]
MIKLIGISGSLRAGSFNSALLRAAAAMMPHDAELRIESIAAIPLYDGDVENQGIPVAVARLKDEVAAADGLVLATPEYNNSVPGVAKNAIDWMSRPPSDSRRVFGGRPVAILGASPGSFGTALSQAAWLPVFRILGADIWTGPRFALARANNAIGANGDLTDPATRELLQKFVDGFVGYVKQRK